MKQLAKLQSNNPELDGELVEIIQPDFQPGQTLVTIKNMKVVFLWANERLQLAPDSLSLQTQANCHAQSKT
jgi:hypothetical protein